MDVGSTGHAENYNEMPTRTSGTEKNSKTRHDPLGHPRVFRSKIQQPTFFFLFVENVTRDKFLPAPGRIVFFFFI